MKKHILYKNHLRKKQFSEALGMLKNEFPKNSEELWICFQLGFYETINNTPVFGSKWREKYARIVSFAACGRTEEATKLLNAFMTHRRYVKHFVALASSLAPYAPTLALEVLEKISSPTLLAVGLQLQQGDTKKAHSLLQYFKAHKSPEYNLYLSNITKPLPNEQLALMNSFLHTYGLSPVSLRSSSLSPSTINIASEENLSFVSGSLVTVLMTAHNSQTHIKSAIESLLNQTYCNIELIVVDDASSDDTQKIVKDLAKNDSRLKYIYLPTNVGTYVAKTVGLEKSSGEFVTCHDSDDWAHPMKIEEQVKPLLKNKKLVFTTSHWVRIEDNGSYYARALHPLLRLNPASPLFRKKLVLEKAGGWDLVRTGADSEFTARLKLVFGRKAMHRVAKPLTFGAHRQESLMNAKTTGYCEKGMSPVRLEYWEAWGHWHIAELRAGRKPFMPLDFHAERQFTAPSSIEVSKEDIRKTLAKKNNDLI